MRDIVSYRSTIGLDPTTMDPLVTRTVYYRGLLALPTDPAAYKKWNDDFIARAKVEPCTPTMTRASVAQTPTSRAKRSPAGRATTASAATATRSPVHRARGGRVSKLL